MNMESKTQLRSKFSLTNQELMKSFEKWTANPEQETLDDLIKKAEAEEEIINQYWHRLFPDKKRN